MLTWLLAIIFALQSYCQQDFSIGTRGNVVVNRSLVPFLEDRTINESDFNPWLWDGNLPGQIGFSSFNSEGLLKFNYHKNLLHATISGLDQVYGLNQIMRFQVEVDSSARFFERVKSDKLETNMTFLEVVKVTRDYEILVERVIKILKGDYNAVLGVGDRNIVKEYNILYLREGDVFNRFRSFNSLFKLLGNKNELKEYVRENELQYSLQSSIEIIDFFAEINGTLD
ncbi:hypothetical protein [Ekhidna sp.]|uniref:hypothetical protein n=1 Tax=Ekhidna sp. TaxID=2608089 RepID=UPI0035128845